MKLYVLDGGRIEILDWARFQPDAGPGVRRWISDSCYLIVHPRGTLMWDTGLPDRLAGVAEGHTIPGVAVFHVTEPLADRLTALGHPPHEIDFLALSHFHPDHVATWNCSAARHYLYRGMNTRPPSAPRLAIMDSIRRPTLCCASGRWLHSTVTMTSSATAPW